MVISRTPLRVSFAGGGTDFPDYYKKSTGVVISSTIDKYVYVTVTDRFDKKINIRYSITEEVDKIDDIQNSIIREAMRLAGVTSGAEIVTIADVPSKGSGLGSSSVLAVGILNALYAYKGCKLREEELAELACRLEIGILNSPIGKQDQYAATFGGLSEYRFRPDNTVDVFDVRTFGVHDKIRWLEESSLLFYLGFTRQANDILKEHKENIESKIKYLDNMVKLAEECEQWLLGKRENKYLTNVINSSWILKKQMSTGYTSEEIEKTISTALEAGASSVKLCGAGGGGFMLVICEREKQEELRLALKGLHELRFKFSLKGSEIIYNDRLY